MGDIFLQEQLSYKYVVEKIIYNFDPNRLILMETITVMSYNAKTCIQSTTKIHTANVNSKITDKLRYLLVISKQTHLFSDIFESCSNHRQMSVKIKIKSHIQQKNWENFASMKKVFLTT